MPRTSTPTRIRHGTRSSTRARSVSAHTTLLRARGLKATPQRLTLLSVLSDATTPLSLRDIEGDPRARHITTSTLYRAIKDCLDAGIVRPVDLRHTHAHYELVSTHDHHHIICTRCGTVEDFTDKACAIRTRSVARSSKKFATITDHTFEVYGVCKQCT